VGCKFDVENIGTLVMGFWRGFSVIVKASFLFSLTAERVKRFGGLVVKFEHCRGLSRWILELWTSSNLCMYC